MTTPSRSTIFAMALIAMHIQWNLSIREAVVTVNPKFYLDSYISQGLYIATLEGCTYMNIDIIILCDRATRECLVTVDK